jgi:hypothetical protein
MTAMIGRETFVKYAPGLRHTPTLEFIPKPPAPLRLLLYFYAVSDIIKPVLNKMTDANNETKKIADRFAKTNISNIPRAQFHDAGKRRPYMLNKKNQNVARILIAITAVIILSTNIYPRMIANDGESAYDGGKSSSISSFIVAGAGYFLHSYSDTLLLLNRVELADVNGIDYPELREILYRAIENMEKAKDAYTLLTETAENTPYNQVFIDQLLLFDYSGLQKESGFNSAVFADVRALLAKGDVTGVFSRILAGTGVVLDTLYTVKERVYAGKFPAVSDLWRLNAAYSETMMFGQSAAEVFASVKGSVKDACE